MANYATLIAAIQSVITQNGNNEITGPILQQTLISVVNSLGSGYQFIGIATPETTPGTPDQKVFYIGSAGTYPNFGPAVIPDGNLAVFYYDSSWHYGSVAFPIGDGAVTESNLATALANKLFASGYKLAGIATPATNPGTPNQNVFYIGGPGQYTNFGTTQTVDDGFLGFFEYNNGWSFETVQVGKNYDQQDQVPRDLSAITVANLRIESNGKWNAATIEDYRHILLAVNPGEKYKITAGTSSNYMYYAFLQSSSCTAGASADFVSGTSRIMVAGGTVVDVTIPETCKFLYFYAGSTSTGTGRQALPTSVIRYKTLSSAIDYLFSQIRRMNGEIPFEFSYNTGKFVNSTSGVLGSGSARAYTNFIDIHNYRRLVYLRAVTTSASPTWGMAFYDSSKNYISGQAVVGGASAYGAQRTKINVPENAYYARFTIYESTSTFYLYDGDAINVIAPDLADLLDNSQSGERRTIRPVLAYDIIRSSNGEFSTNPDFANMYELATSRFIKTSKNVSIKVSTDCLFNIFYYDANFAYLGKDANYTSLTANVEVNKSLEYECTYIKFYLYKTGGIPNVIAELTGYFPEDWDTFNPRPADSGYHRVSVLVNVTNPTCCDEETQTVQDARQLLPDYGVICLPQQYSHKGKPTRLIIYCHGAAVNYSSDVTRFNSVDLDPTYWLAEGYAILDVEGNPFDNENEHICIPQTMDCYVAAYKWAIEHYNLCRDGIFLGGRSMGGQNTFNLMRRECPIPVIAACPNSAAPDLSFGYSQATRKAFCALHMGFVVPSGFTWSDGVLNASEIQVLKDNWDKYVKCCPELSACLNLPDKDTLFDNLRGEARIALWSTLHMMAKCPVKMFGCNQDPSCPPPSTTSLYYRMLINSGQITECRLFNSYKDYTGTGTTAHHYDTQDPALRVNITTTYGVALTAVPIVYIEMLEFWRRYEQGN